MTRSLPDTTRERLLDQAETLFALKGFAAVSVREITAAAGTNLAAVNYHFGNKKNLYLAVFRERLLPRARQVRQGFFDNLAAIPSPGIRDVIRAMATASLEGPLTDLQRRNHMLLMQQEMSHPTEALSMVVNQVIRPKHEEIRRLIRPHLPAGIDDKRLTLYILSIVGLTLHFSFARPVISLLTGRNFDQGFKAQLIDHLVAFAMEGINGLKKEGD